MRQLIIHTGQDHFLGLFTGQLGDLFQLRLLGHIQGIDFFLLGLDLIFFAVQL